MRSDVGCANSWVNGQENARLNPNGVKSQGFLPRVYTECAGIFYLRQRHVSINKKVIESADEHGDAARIDDLREMDLRPRDAPFRFDRFRSEGNAESRPRVLARPRTIAAHARRPHHCPTIHVAAALPRMSAFLLFVFRVQELFLEFADRRMIVAVAHDAIDGARDVAAAHVADDRSVCALQPRRMLTDPIVIFDGRLDSAVVRNVYSDLRQKVARMGQIFEIFVRRAFPKMNMERFVANDFGACG
ncbi:hypothetical protein [Burkholderia sp. MSMB1498]|uniref:hypothetical protein n=1 Tax=Burkholderia sp. MSMB1498 TaxID=1637842 RepID=UPI0012E390FD|nr:hypothetical protein [Burkholderia sp. MSMB1498]